ncbi:YidB family protein [Acinetobacter lactucae]|uniref:YidB family protein n=1 Tax=Acinetobacter lactucae TaxID=1785128 RepID=A0AB35K346_9GAMM|nr:YidB family protein [Acinetobacter lactucae]MDD9316984.1 YidB family protein [Acinetobacter lactucae]MDD9321068.1 YidB family protein [Acinetobacter lactucae]
MTNLSNIVEALAKQALGGNQQASSQGGLGGILGSVLGQMGGNNTSSGAQGGLGGVLGSVLGQVTGNNNASQTSGGVQSLLIAVVPLILGWVQQQGGLQAALEKLKGAGLGSQVQSWVDPNQSNSEVPTQQLQSLFTPADIEQVAEQAQAPKEQVYGAIASVLPQVIDSLTPQGESTNPQEANQDIQNVMNLVRGFLK